MYCLSFALKFIYFIAGQDLKRENKNRPREMSSKKTVKRYRDVVGLTAEQNIEKRDPRFDNLCGEFDKKVCIPLTISIRDRLR